MSQPNQPPSDDALINAALRQFQSARPRPTTPGGGRFDTPLDARAVARKTISQMSADSLVGYELLGERHRGGQGVVYEALQRATKRKVAVKILYDGPHQSVNQRRRFELEIEILSQLRHPNIVTVYDSGTADGRSFYVMDLVAGVPLDRWVEQQRQKRLDAAVATGSRAGVREEIGELLRLFVRISDAVNAAHLRGVIHRDLKPGNILIDGAGQPHILDFGLAKFTAGTFDDPSGADPMTITGQFVGSLPWASPEQAAGEPNQIDTRSDVYALGVLLYQSLTGQFPYRVTGPNAETIERIRSQAPRAMNDARRIPSSASGPLGVMCDISDEVETIVLKCLQKERERRYQTAGDLARDLQRCLDGAPIEAKRDSFAYMLRKQVRRHRLAVTAAGLVLAAIVIGLVASLTFWRQAERRRVEAERESARAHAAEQDAERETERARNAEREAQTKRAEADSVTTLLEQMFGSSDAYQFPGPDASIKQVIDEYGAKVFTGLESQPEVELRLRLTLGNAFYNLAEFDKAEQMFTRAVEIATAVLGPHAPRVSEMLNNLGSVRLARNDLDGAQQAYESALAIDQATRGDPQCLEADTLYNLGNLAVARGNAGQAEELYRRSLERFAAAPPERQSGLSAAMKQLGSLLSQLGRNEEAEKLLRDALAMDEHQFGPDDTRTAAARNDLASWLYRNGRAAEAIPLFEAVLAADSKFFGPRDPRRAIHMSNFAIILKSLGQLDRAEALHREALSIRQESLPPDHPELALSWEGLATIQEARKDWAGAAEAFSRAQEINCKNGDDNPACLRNSQNLGRVKYAAGKYAEAREIYRRILASATPGSVEAFTNGARLAATEIKLGNFAPAAEILRGLVNVEPPAGQPAWTTAQLQSLLGEAELGLAHPDEAESLLRDGYAGLASGHAPVDRQREALQRLINLAEKRGDSDGADGWRAKMADLETPQPNVN